MRDHCDQPSIWSRRRGKCTLRYEDIGLHSGLRWFKDDRELKIDDPYLYELTSAARKLVEHKRPPKTNAYNEFLKDFVYVCELDPTHWNLISSCGSAIWRTKDDMYHGKYHSLAQNRKKHYEVTLAMEAGRSIFDARKAARRVWPEDYERYFYSATDFVMDGR